MKWQAKLTKKEMKHLKETMDYGVTLRGLKSNRKHQKDNNIECYECRHIAIKLGLESI